MEPVGTEKLGLFEGFRQEFMSELDRLAGMCRNSDGDTCRDAAQSVLPRLSTDRQRVLEWLEANGPSTDFEIARGLDGIATSYGKRRKELGCLDTGERRPSRPGSRTMATVWRLP